MGMGSICGLFAFVGIYDNMKEMDLAPDPYGVFHVRVFLFVPNTRRPLCRSCFR